MDIMAGINEVLGGGGIHHISMYVKDLDTSVKFYCEVMGFKEALTWMKDNDRAIILDSGDGSFFELFESVGGNNQTGAIRHVALRTLNCGSVIEKVRAAGYEITMEPRDVILSSNPPTPIRIAFFKGPDGESVELFQYR